MRIRTFTTNIYIATLYRFILAMLLFQMCRIFFYVANTDLFPDTTWSDMPQLMLGGMVFDLSGVIYVNLLFLVMQIIPFRLVSNAIYQTISRGIFYTCNSIALAANLMDTFYYRFTLRRTSFFFFEEFKNETHKLRMISHIIADYWYTIIVFAMIVLLMAKAVNLVKVKPINIKGYKYYIPATALTLITLTLMVGGVRGGFAHSTRPITVSNASQYVANIGEEAIVLNTPFSMIRTSEAKSIQEYHYFTNEAKLNAIYTPIHQAHNGSINKKNIVILILESFGKEYVGAYNHNRGIANYQGYTPFLDSLITVSTTFKHSLANGRKSIDAMASIFASIPAVGNSFILTPYSSNQFQSIFEILKTEGYNTSFFHGAPNGSMGFLAFSKKIGIDHYHGRNEYNTWRPGNNDFDGMWGIWDNKFLEYYSHELNLMKEPFLSSIFTLSSHHPFKVPTEYEGKFPKGNLPIHQPIGYTDMALRNFFDRAQQQAWFNNTIFVLCADHANQSFYKEYQNNMGMFEIPIIIYEPAKPKGKMMEKLASQIDIMPTLLQMIGYNKAFFSFGHNLYDERNENFTINSLGETHFLYYKNYIASFNNNGKVLSIHDYTQLGNENLLDKCPEQDIITQKAHAFMQQHNNRLIENKLTLNID